MRRLLYCFLALSLVPLCAVPSDLRTSGWTFAGFQQTLTNLSFQVKPGSPEDHAISSISESLDRIRTGYLAKYGDSADTEEQIAQNLAPEYSRSMVDDLTALKSWSSGDGTHLAAIKEVRDDLAVKALALSSTTGLTTTVFPSIVQLNVSVTLSAGSPISPSAVSIRANPHHFGTNPPPAYILGNGIALQTAHLPPGRFWIWIEVNGTVLQSQERDLGSDGAASADVNFSF
jgi:hypothetical protein